MTTETQIAALTEATTSLLGAVNEKKETLDQSVNAAGDYAQRAETAESGAQALLSQTQAAKDEAVAGLGAADQSLNLVQLAGAVAGAIDLAGQAVKESERGRSYRTQRGEATVTQAASKEHARSYATVAVTLSKPYPDANYLVHRECVSAAPFQGAEGNIQVLSQSANGFVLAITGSATHAGIRWSTHYPNAR